MTRKTPKNDRKSSEISAFVLLDNAYNGLLKAVLWWETSKITISVRDRDNIAGSITTLLEFVRNSLENGGNSDEIASIIRRTGQYIDDISTVIKPEYAPNSGPNSSKNDEKGQ